MRLSWKSQYYSCVDVPRLLANSPLYSSVYTHAEFENETRKPASTAAAHSRGSNEQLDVVV